MAPLSALASGWLCGLWLAYGADLCHRPTLALAGLVLAMFAACFSLPRRKGFTAHVPWAPFGLLASLAGMSTGLSLPQQPDLTPGLTNLEVRVLRTQAEGDGTFVSDVEVLRGRHAEEQTPLPAGIRLRLRPKALPEGQYLRLRAVVNPTRDFRNQSPHPPWPTPDPLAGFGRILSQPQRLPEQSSARSVLVGSVGTLRGQLRASLGSHLNATSAGLAQALLLGDRLAVARELRDQVNLAGVSHVLAVSGLHVGVLAGLWIALLRRCLLCVPPLTKRFDVSRLAFALGLPVLLLLVPMCGGAASVRRAALTAALAWTIRCLEGRAAPSATLALTVLCLTAAEPTLALSPGFLLSVTATVAVLTALDPGTTARHSPLFSALSVSLACTLATAPTLLWCFDQVAVVGVLANLVVVPWVSLALLPLAVAHGLVGLLVPAASPLTAGLFELTSGVFVAMVERFSSWAPVLPVPVPNVAQGLLLAVMCGGLLLNRTLGRRRTAALAVACLVGTLCAEWYLRRAEQPRGRLRVTFVDVGQGDAALIDLPDGSLMLVDAGGDPTGFIDPGERVLVPLLRARRRDRIDLAVLSHPHPDHYGGLRALLDAFPVTELWDNGQAFLEEDMSASSREAAALLRHAVGRGTRLRFPSQLCGGPHDVGGVMITVLWPCPGVDEALGENDNSLVVRIDFGSTSVLFAGDIEASSEHRLAPLNVAPAQVLKVAHHGSRTSSSAEFLAPLQPQLAVISAGRSNRFSHPHAEAVERLTVAGAKVVNLAQQGSLTLESDGRRLTFLTWSGLAGTVGGRSPTPSRAFP